MLPNRRGGAGHSRQQRGVALIVVLLLLLVVTLLGLGSMRNALLQERMAANTVARGYAFQAAEGALREAEGFAEGNPTIPAAGCSNGVCAQAIDGALPAWQEDGFWDDGGSGYREAAAVDAGEGSFRPRYVVEDYGTASSDPSAGPPIDMGNPPPPNTPDMRVFRITVRSRTENGAEVMLQSLYRIPNTP